MAAARRKSRCTVVIFSNGYEVEDLISESSFFLLGQNSVFKYALVWSFSCLKNGTVKMLPPAIASVKFL